MNSGTRELNIIGHWGSSSKMPERYGRSVCANELLIRNTIMSKFNEGWTTVPSFHLPLSVDSSQRVGKALETVAPTEKPVDTQLELTPTETPSGTQLEPTLAEISPLPPSDDEI